MLQVVKMSDYKVSDDSHDELITYSLGSCVGLALYDPLAKVGGMVHCMLPLAKINPERAREMPGMFADTGVSLLIQTMIERGANKKKLVAKVAGAASLLGDNGIFRIGERNYTMLRKILWKNEITISGESVGGSIPRTMSLHIGNGIVAIKSGQNIVKI